MYYLVGEKYIVDVVGFVFVFVHVKCGVGFVSERVVRKCVVCAM